MNMKIKENDSKAKYQSPEGFTATVEILVCEMLKTIAESKGGKKTRKLKREKSGET